MDAAEIVARFGYHAPRDEETKRELDSVRDTCRDFAQFLDCFVPDCREKSLAITHLEEVMMWANAAIARAK
jgi:hypothetical protein